MTHRDNVHNFIDCLRQSLDDGEFVHLLLGGYHGEERDLRRVAIKRVLIKRVEKLSFTFSYKTRDIVKNYTVGDGDLAPFSDPVSMRVGLLN